MRLAKLASVAGAVALIASTTQAQEFRAVGGEFQVNAYTLNSQYPFDVGLAAFGGVHRHLDER